MAEFDLQITINYNELPAFASYERVGSEANYHKLHFFKITKP
jgi:hypothetical protein